jgi:predicted O-linked N-acetylglucosamine transferase (SPINDLY family)
MTQTRAKFQRALALHQRGYLTQARILCEEILTIEPNHLDTLYVLGMMAGQMKDFAGALDWTARVLKIDPDNAIAHNNRGLALKGLDDLDGALMSYDRAIAIKPDYPVAYNNRGNVLKELKRADAALQSYDRALALAPDYVDAHYNRAVLLGDLEQWEAAAASYENAIAIRADHAEAHCNLGAALQALKRFDAAAASFIKAISIKPTLSKAHSNLGNVLRELERFNEALDSCERAIVLEETLAEAHLNRGNVLYDLKKWDVALASYDRAITLRPKLAEAHINRGNLLFSLKQQETAEAAVASLEIGLTLKPDSADAHEILGHVLRDLKQHEAAIASYDRAMALDPDRPFLHGLRQHVRMEICDWRDFDSEVSELKSRIERGEAASPPLPVLAVLDSAPLQRQAAEIWVKKNVRPHPLMPAIAKRPQKGKIRIGYFSADFREHPVATLTAELFESHDRSRFESIAFSFGPDTKDAMRTRLERAFDRFIDVRDSSERDIAMLSRRMDIDIGVDLSGYSEGCRPRIFSMGAAPLQVSYLGYRGTTGAGYMDYLVADKTIVPLSQQPHYAEKLLYLPSYQANSVRRPIADRLFTRDELGLPTAGFVFCCFNANFKITPRMYECWMRILERVAGSVLFLFAGNEAAGRNLRAAARQQGVNAERVIFADRLPIPEYLARYRAADLFLDTLPYNAGTTASDALWAGLPVLTCRGDTFAGRMVGSLLSAIGLPELITETQAAYEDLAVELANDPGHLAKIKQALSVNRLATRLFDIRRFTRDLETGYTRIYERYQADLPPDHVHVEPP